MVVTETEPACEVTFREVTHLKGSVAGRTARVPVALAPDGRYLTATYGHGEVAIWSASGHLKGVIGKGPVQGPGEFNTMTGLLVASDGIVDIFTSYARFHRYTLDGEFVETGRLPTPVGAQFVTMLDDGRMVAWPAIGGGRQFLIGPDSIEPFGPEIPPLQHIGDGLRCRKRRQVGRRHGGRASYTS